MSNGETKTRGAVPLSFWFAVLLPLPASSTRRPRRRFAGPINIKLNPMDAIVIVAAHFGGDTQRETSFAAASGPCERHQPRRCKLLHDFTLLTLTPDKAGQNRREASVRHLLCLKFVGSVHRLCQNLFHLLLTVPRLAWNPALDCPRRALLSCG